MYELFRDDDISVTSNITLLMQVHNEFVKRNKVHTVAVLMENLWENKEIWYWLMTASNLQIGLHGWKHEDYGKMSFEDICYDIRRSINYWQVRALQGKYKPRRISTFFPPWNSASPELARACEATDMKLDARVGFPVYNFHYWACSQPQQMDKLIRALAQ